MKEQADNCNTLLVIDDERDLGEFVRVVGEEVGYSVQNTDQPEQFIAALSSPPRVVILDLNMPGVDGVELLREMADRKVDSRIVIASGVDPRALDTTARLGRSLGLNIAGVLAKPFRRAVLSTLLRSLFLPSVELSDQALIQAIENGQIYPLYQPKIELASGRCVGVEMLARWRAPNGAAVGPDTFIPYAEKCGIIGKLTNWALQTGLEQARAWTGMGLGLKVSINISAANLGDGELPNRLDGLCRKVGVPPETLILELTETAAMRDGIKLMEVLSRLRIKGFGLSIDDFGTGYSSLALLHRMPFSELKIDRSFVTVMDHDAEVISRITTVLGHELGMTVTAEGVETRESLNRLIEYGVDHAQGYLMSVPCMAKDIPAFVRQQETGG